MPQQRDRRSPERRAGDDLLLAAPGDGWVDVEQLRRHMMPHVMPGKAHRETAATRKDVYDEDGVRIRTHDSKRRDALLVGQRQAATRALQNAIRDNRWERSADRSKVRHCDHQPVDGFTIPTAADMAGVGPSSDAVALVERLSRATHWEKAAIVVAFVEVRPDNNAGANRANLRGFSTKSFARLGIAGLTSDRTVARYVSAWTEVAGLERPNPGDTITLPDIPFPSIKDAKDSDDDGKPTPVPTDVRKKTNAKRTRTTLPPSGDTEAWGKLIAANHNEQQLRELLAWLTEYQREITADPRLRAVN